MKYTNRYEIAGGTVQGRQHALLGRNSQDAFAWAARDGVLAAAVCDGCGGAPHSEAGARMGARIAVEEMLARRTDLDGLRGGFLGRLAKIAAAIGPSACEYLLFTLVGAVVADGEAVVFTCGDGLVAVNGSAQAIGPEEEPPYPGYALFGGEAAFTVRHR